MSKRGSDAAGADDPYAHQADQVGNMSDIPKQATAAQLARRKIAQARKPSGSQRNSRQGTPTGNLFNAPQQQSMPAFTAPAQSGTGFGGDFSFTANNNVSNPFAQQNGASSTPPPTTFQFGSTQPQQNGGTGGMFGNTNTSFGSQPQQNGFNTSTSIFGQSQNNAPTNNAAPSFGSFGQANQNQSQQNGLTPSTNASFPSFGQNGDNPFKGFGQSSQQQQTQSTPNTSFGGFGQNSQQNGDKPKVRSFLGTPGPDSQLQQNGDKSLFGATSQAEQPPKTATSNIFAGIGQQSQQNGNKPITFGTSQAEQTPKLPATSNIFGGQEAGKAIGLFGSTPPPTSGTNTPNLGESVFSAWNQSKKDAVTPGMFTQNRGKENEQPKPATNNIFGGLSSQSQPTAAEEPPAKRPGFFGSTTPSQADGSKPSLFSGLNASQSGQQTPKASSNLFGGPFGQAPSTQQSSTPAFTLGQSQQDTSMTTPDNTPQKSAQRTGAIASAPTDNASSQTPMGGGKSLFSRTSSDTPATAEKISAFAPSSSLFLPQSGSDSAVNKTAETFQTDSLFQSTATSNQPKSILKPSSSSQATSNSLLDRPSAAPWLSHQPSAVTAAQAHTQATQAQQPPAITTTAPAETSKTTTMNEVIPEAERNTFKVLNEGLKAHLAKQNPNVDWTTIFQYYLQQAAKIRNKPAPAFDTPTPAASGLTSGRSASSIASASTSIPASKPSLFSAQTPTAPRPTAFTPTMQETPKQPNNSSLSRPPQTAPVNKKRPAPFEEDEPQAPATEKRLRPSIPPTEYPKLPENASDTAKAFAAALDRPAAAAPAKEPSPTFGGFKPSNAGSTLFAGAKSTMDKEVSSGSDGFKPATGGFTPSAGAPSSSSAKEGVSNSGGFKPSTTGFAPSGGMPTFTPAASGGGALAAFGKKASAEEEKEKKKRKAEDYDSDDETEEAWAARDQAEQDAKRQKILEAAKAGSAWTPSGAATPAEGISDNEQEKEKDKDVAVETPMGQGKSMFDRVTRDPPATAPSKQNLFAPQTSKPSIADLFGSKTPAGAGTTLNVTGSSLLPKASSDAGSSEKDKTEAEKEQGSGDNTWKPNTPIKFGASTSSAGEESTGTKNAFSSLFGTATGKPSTSTDSTGHLSVPGAKPAIGFNFAAAPSSLGTSRATTPGFTTDGEGASTAGEGDDAEGHEAPQNEKQVEDQTGLHDEEREHEDVLYEVAMAKGMKYDEKKDPDSGEMGMGWVDKGKGPLYVLQHKETGKVRVLLKVPPYGNPRMNFTVLKDGNYELLGKAGKMVQGTFVDHLNAKKDDEGGKLTRWIIQVGKAEDAAGIKDALVEAAAKEA